MNGRFAAAVAAFACAAALVVNGSPLPEFFVQLRDRNLLAGPIFGALLHVFGYPFVLAFCGVLCGAAILLVGWRTRMRGAPDWYAGLAALLAALCFTGRFGVSFDPLGWFFAAWVCLLCDRNDSRSHVAVVGVVAAWSLLQGGGTFGVLIAFLFAAGAFLDVRRLDSAVRRRFAVAGACAVVAAVQIHGPLSGLYGSHVLYLDALLSGAQRDRIWTGSISTQALGFAAIVVLAGWYGMRRRGKSADALIFFAGLILALADARNLPYFAIAAAPAVADTVASYYVQRRRMPIGGLRSYAIAVSAAAAVFVAPVSVLSPRALGWPPAPGIPFEGQLQAGPRHRVLCVRPRWCDPLAGPHVAVVLDDAAGSASPSDRRLQRDVAAQTGHWQAELTEAKIDAIVARNDDAIVSLLGAQGWRSSRSGAEVLLQPEISQ